MMAEAAILEKSKKKLLHPSSGLTNLYDFWRDDAEWVV